ncbi:hypothetical protein AAHH78_42460, partial [Burkholderia pseudomallei]
GGGDMPVRVSRKRASSASRSVRIAAGFRCGFAGGRPGVLESLIFDRSPKEASHAGSRCARPSVMAIERLAAARS